MYQKFLMLLGRREGAEQAWLTLESPHGDTAIWAVWVGRTGWERKSSVSAGGDEVLEEAISTVSSMSYDALMSQCDRDVVCLSNHDNPAI